MRNVEPRMAARDPLKIKICLVLLTSSVAPADFRVRLVVHAGNFKGIEALGVIIEKQEVGAGVLQMARVDPLVLAIMNPESVKYARHSGGAPRIHLIELHGAVIQRHAGEGPDI